MGNTPFDEYNNNNKIVKKHDYFKHGVYTVHGFLDFRFLLARVILLSLLYTPSARPSKFIFEHSHRFRRSPLHYT